MSCVCSIRSVEETSMSCVPYERAYIITCGVVSTTSGLFYLTEPLVRIIPKVKWTTFANSGHLPSWEESEAWNREVHMFLSY